VLASIGGAAPVATIANAIAVSEIRLARFIQ
jgi:hypothetical protein